MASKTSTKTATAQAGLNGRRVQSKARPGKKRDSKPAKSAKETERAPTREVILEDGTVGEVSLYKAQRGKKHFTKEELELIAATRAVLEALENQEKAANAETGRPAKTSVDRKKLAHYKARPNKEHYTAEELECIALTRAVFEALEHQEKLYP